MIGDIKNNHNLLKRAVEQKKYPNLENNSGQIITSDC